MQINADASWKSFGAKALKVSANVAMRATAGALAGLATSKAIEIGLNKVLPEQPDLNSEPLGNQGEKKANAAQKPFQIRVMLNDFYNVLNEHKYSALMGSFISVMSFILGPKVKKSQLVN